MKRFALFRWLAALTLAIAAAPSLASAQEADTLSISGTFSMDSLGGTVGNDLLAVYANGQEHTWTLTLHGVSYSHFHWGDYYGWDEEYFTDVHATSFDFEFFGPDADILNAVFSPQLTSGDLSDGAFVRISNYFWDYGWDAEGRFHLSLRSDDPLEGVTTFNCYATDYWTLFPVDENGYPLVQPRNFVEYAWSYLYDSRCGNSGGLYSHADLVALGSSEPPVLPPPPPPPPPTLSIADASVREGNSGTTWLDLAVSLSRYPDDVVTVNYQTADGTAKKKSDYTATSGALLFWPDENIRTISIAIKTDSKREPNETFSVHLSNAVGATIADGVATATILNDD